MTITRRTLASVGAAALAAPLLSRGLGAADTPATATSSGGAVAADPGHSMDAYPAHWFGKEKIAFLMYPGFTALDMVGPHYMLGSLMGASTYVVGKTQDPVVSDMGLTITPQASFATCPTDLDILFVPGGGAGTLAAMKDGATLNFIRDRGARAKIISSVCTGSLLLAAAGLLKGYNATSHWVARDLLKDFGAVAVNQRVVVDRNRITGAGVTAGLDFGLSLVAQLRDADYAKAMQLLAEYHPEPPYDSGTPERAGTQTTAMIADMFNSFVADVRTLAKSIQ